MVGYMAGAARIRCRLIDEGDLPEVCRLLSAGFPDRSGNYWRRGLEILSQRPALQGYPRFGHLLECEGKPVGSILTIYDEASPGSIRCNISSWYVEEPFRAHASFLIASAVRRKEVTYFNISPAPHTRNAIEAQGFHRYCNGLVLTFPALSPSGWHARVHDYASNPDMGASLTAREKYILDSHLELGCKAFIVTTGQALHPFLFMPRRMLRGLLPTLQLIYCRDIADISRLAGPLGRTLLSSGHASVIIDANQTLPGVAGKFFMNRGPRYFKGPEPPRPGDSTFTELVLFGP